MYGSHDRLAASPGAIIRCLRKNGERDIRIVAVDP